MKIKYALNVWVVFALITCLFSTSFAGSEADSDDTEYFAVYMEGKKIGHAIQGRVVADEKVTTSEQVNLTINRGGMSVTIDMKETSIETTSGEPLGFEVTQKLGAMAMKVMGRIDKQGKVALTTSSVGTDKKSTLEWPQGALMPEGLRLLTLKKGLKEGTEYSVKI